MKRMFAVATLTLVLASPGLAFAHAGALDKNGCHHNNQTKLYECHRGSLKGQTFKTKADAEKALAAAGGKSATSGAGQASGQTAKTPGERPRTKAPTGATPQTR